MACILIVFLAIWIQGSAQPTNVSQSPAAISSKTVPTPTPPVDQHEQLFNGSRRITHLSEGNFTQVTSMAFPPSAFNTSTQWFIMYYARWCPHCRQLIPTFIQIPIQQMGFDVKLGVIQCPINQKLCRSYNIMGYPTLFYFKGSKKYEFPARKPRTLDNLKEFIISMHNQKEFSLVSLENKNEERVAASIAIQKFSANFSKEKLILLVLVIGFVSLCIFKLISACSQSRKRRQMVQPAESSPKMQQMPTSFLDKQNSNAEIDAVRQDNLSAD